jgi:hypothetical protein
MASFLRRVSRGSSMRDGILDSRIFLCRQGEEELSYTRTTEDTGGLLDLAEYQAAHPLESGDLPGIVEITEEDFNKAGIPIPTFRPDPNDRKYGHLHFTTPSIESTKAEHLAQIVSKTGIRLKFRRHKSSG